MRQNALDGASQPSAATAYRRLKFNDRTILALKPTHKRVQYWDESLPGFGLRVSPPNRKSPKGRKTWIVMYRRPSGSAVRLKLGTYPAVGLAEARVKAKEYLGQIEIEGRDPVRTLPGAMSATSKASPNADYGRAQRMTARRRSVRPSWRIARWRWSRRWSEKRADFEMWARYLEAILANRQPAATFVQFRR